MQPLGEGSLLEKVCFPLLYLHQHIKMFDNS